MPFEKRDKPMTTKDQINRPVTVVSTQSGNDMDVAAIPTTDAGEQFVEAGDIHTLDALANEEPSKDAQAVKGIDPESYVGFSKGQPINKINANDLSDFMRESVIARPLRIPSKLNARSKDPNYRLRWVEFKAEDGRRYNDCLEAGFTNATKDDVVGIQVKVNSDGTIKSDDLILMKIPCELVDGYLKHNALKALKMVSKTGVKQMAQREGQKILQQGAEEHGRRVSYGEYKDKLEIF